MLKIAICDDEIQFRRIVKKLLEEYLTDKKIEYSIDTYESGENLLENIVEVQEYNIMFLDINMVEVDGIETGQRIREYSKTVDIVFITAHIKYSLEGYKVGATRYLLKDSETLGDTLKECMDYIMEKRAYKSATKIFKFCEGNKEIFVKDILYVESRLHRVEYHISGNADNIYTQYSKLDEVERILEGCGFIRIHQSYLVNPAHIKSMKRYQVVMTSGDILSIPKDRYLGVEEAFVAYKGEM